jgi:hypothetical protein
MDPRHPYEQISLFTAGILLAVWLISVHAVMLAKPTQVQGYMKKFPRDVIAGQILLALGMAWFWLLVAPDGMGKLSALQMDLGEFNKAKPLLRLVVPVAVVAVAISVRDFLAVRALGLCGLLLAAPLLESAFLKDPTTRLLIPIFAYAMLTASLFMVGMPYLFRDAVTWVSASRGRWATFGLSGLAYGVATLVCAILFWRGY